MGALLDFSGTLETLFKFGLNGLNLRTVASRLECRNAANTGFGDFVAGAITGSRPQITVTASKAIALADFGTHQLSTAGTAVIITVPKDATLGAAIGTEVEVSWDGVGSVSIAQEDVNINIRRFGSAAVTGHTLAGRYASCVLVKRDVNEWRAYGAFV